MPTQIRTIPPPHSPPETDHEKNAHYHREALRLALGSILAPKRTFTPSSSRSASGTSSPAYPGHFSNTASSPTTPSPPHPPHPTPAQGHSRHWDAHGHWDAHLYPLPHPHTHYPSRLGMSRTNSSESVSSSNSGSPVSSPRIAPSQIPPEQHPPPTEAPAIMISPSTPPIHAPTPVQPAAPTPILPNSSAETTERIPRPMMHRPPDQTTTAAGHNHIGNGTPKGKWIKTLDSKSSAWDALIHGSFS